MPVLRRLTCGLAFLALLTVPLLPHIASALDVNFYKVHVSNTSGSGVAGAKVSMSFYERCDMGGYNFSEDRLTGPDGMTEQIPSNVTRYDCVRVSVMKDGYLPYSKPDRMKNTGGKVIQIVLKKPEEGPY